MNYIGKIVIAAGATKSNRTTAEPFDLPAGVCTILIEPMPDTMEGVDGDTAKVYLETSGDPEFATDADRGVGSHAGSGRIVQVPEGQGVISVHNPLAVGVTAKIWRIAGQPAALPFQA